MDIDLNLVKGLKEIILESYNESLKINKNVINKENNDIVTDIDIFMEAKMK